VSTNGLVSASLAVIAALLAAGATAGPPREAARTFPPAEMVMAWVPAQTFEMGCVPADASCFPEEGPRHAVALGHGFWIGVTDVTVAAYRAFAAAAGSPMPAQPIGAHDNHPVVNVSWDDATAYCAWSGGRLPSEAEWEAAARGGRADTVFPWGDEASHDAANFAGTAGRDRWSGVAPVASFGANAYGLFDMAGNVWQWCADWYSASAYAPGAVADPVGPPDGVARVVRGGSYNDRARSMRLSDRGRFRPAGRATFIGFRCARDGSPPAALAEIAPPPTPGPAAAAGASNGRTAGTTRRFEPAGDEMAGIPPGTATIGCVRGDGVCGGDRLEEGAPVGSFPPNDFGLFDMPGNVCEW
jgi:formylglycine-generating enzyme required for sulfatase activity